MMQSVIQQHILKLSYLVYILFLNAAEQNFISTKLNS